MTPVDAQEAIDLLDGPHEDGLSLKEKILAEASTTELIIAMHKPKTADVYQALCQILGKRKDAQAVPSLIEALHDTDDIVRNEAAQALASIGSKEAGEDLLTQYLQEESDGAKDWEVIALGAVGYRPAIPHLIEALQMNHLRRYAALALGELKAKEAKEEMQQALARETDPYTAKLMLQAINKLDE